MNNYEYHNIIDYWTSQYGLYISMDERNEIIRLFETELIKYNPDLDFDVLCSKLCARKYLNEKYAGLDIWDRIYLRYNHS